jgi:hypothetical protein
LALNPNGWIDGITATGVVLFGIIFGIFFFYKSRKKDAKLLSYLALANLLAGLMFLGVFLDFCLVLITGSNIVNIIFVDPLGSFNFIPQPPAPPSLNLIDYNVNLLTLAGMLMGGLLLSVLIYLGFGFLIKALQSSGVIRKNFFLLSIGSLSFCIFGLLEGLTAPGILGIFVRLGYVSSFIFMYFGL